MKVFIAIVLILGAIVLSVIMAILIATLLYALARVCVLILNLFKPFNKRIYSANQGTQSRWYRDYIKYSISNYLCLLFRDNRIAKAIFNYLSAYTNSNGNDKGNQNIVDLSEIPLSNKILNSATHADNLAQGQKHVNHKQTEP